MKKLSLFTILFLSLVKVPAQPQLAPISIGNVVPNVQISDVRYYLRNSFNLDDFKGKLVIFDFWNLGCKPCIESFPKLDSLQNEFGEKIKIVLVTETPASTFDQMYATLQKRSALLRYKHKLVSVIGDTVLARLFPHNGVPHSVWINKDGVLQAATSSRNINAENIKKMLANADFKLPDANIYLGFDKGKTYFSQMSIQYPENLTFYSSLFKYVSVNTGGQQKLIVDSTNNTVRIRRTGDILSFYGNILSGGIAGNPFEYAYYDYGKRLILETKIKGELAFGGSKDDPTYDKWKAENFYTYETVLPLMSYDEVNTHFLSDINRYFGLEAKIENREMASLLLVRTSTEDKIKTKANENERHTNGTDATGTFFYRNSFMLGFLYKLAYANKSTPQTFLDSTSYKGKIDIALKATLSNLAEVKKELRNKYDLDLIEKIQKVPVLVISDKKK